MDIVFYSHANSATGFGHAARAAKICHIIQKINPDLKCGFFGNFDNTARRVMRTIADVDFVEKPYSKVGVYDRMDDTDDPYYWSDIKLSILLKSCSSVVFMANSPMVPELPEQVTVIGYKIGNQNVSRKNCHWGLQYAPIDFEISNEVQRPIVPGEIFVSLGGSNGCATTKKVIDAVNRIDQINEVTILTSPVNPIDITELIDCSKKPIKFVSNVPCLEELVQTAEIVVASYGHFAYEAIAMRKAVCIVGQKDFQTRYAAAIANRGLCVSGGLVLDVSVDSLRQSIEKTFKNREDLIKTSSQFIDGQGLLRIAHILIAKIEKEKLR